MLTRKKLVKRKQNKSQCSLCQKIIDKNQKVIIADLSEFDFVLSKIKNKY